MKNKSKLAFEMLELEMEVIQKDEMRNFYGGDGPTWSSGGWFTDALSAAFGTTVISGTDDEGNWIIKIGNSSPIPLKFNLQEVTITSNGVKSGDGEDIDGWFDLFQPPNYYGNNNNTSGYVPTNGESPPWEDVQWNDFAISLQSYYTGDNEENLTGYNSAGYNSAGYNSSGYNSAGYNSAGYNNDGINVTTFVNLNPMIGLTSTSVVSQFQQLSSDPWSGQNGLTTYTGTVQTLNSSLIPINMDLTIDNGKTYSMSITMGSYTFSYLAEVGYTFGVTIDGVTQTAGMSLERGILFGNSITNGAETYGQEFSHTPGWGDVVGALSIMTAIETGGASLEAWAELGTLFSL